ncbi:MAG: RNA polymerase sigma factor [Ruminococcaceae bacterium]|nr:RNA polymerase sigma factor [Oscillospiraceae bacterium]
MDNGASSYRRFLEGDDSSFVEIIRDYKDGLILYLNGITCNIHTAEEAAEETFYKLVVKKPKYTPKASFKTWLYTIGRNTALDYMRKNSKKNDVSLYECSSFLKDEVDLERSYIKEERKIILHRALNKLKTEHRQVLWLLYFENFTSKECAGIMAKSAHSIEAIAYRAKMALKKQLESEDFVYEEL